MTETLFDETVKNAMKAVEEARAFNWCSTEICVPTDEIATKIESLIRSTPQFTYKRYGRFFELYWAKDYKEQQYVEVPNPAFDPSLEQLGLLMENLDFGFI